MEPEPRPDSIDEKSRPLPIFGRRDDRPYVPADLRGACLVDLHDAPFFALAKNGENGRKWT